MIFWLLEVSLHNAYVLYTHCGGKLSPLNFRLEIVSKWESDYQAAKNNLMEEEFETFHSLSSEKALGVNDCDICSNRNGTRKRTSYFCAGCTIRTKKNIIRKFYCCPECFHIHLKEQGVKLNVKKNDLKDKCSIHYRKYIY